MYKFTQGFQVLLVLLALVLLLITLDGINELETESMARKDGENTGKNAI